MPSKQKRNIARKNGAKAAGSKTPQGIQTSATNALRHGLTSKTLVLANECPAKFNQLLQMYIEKFQPRDGVEMNLVDEMVAARWRQQRGWVIQTAVFNLQLESALQEATSAPESMALAFIAMSNHEKLLELILRYETSYSRMHDRAIKALFRLREEVNLRNDPKPGPNPPIVVQKRSSVHPPVRPIQATPAAISGTDGPENGTQSKPGDANRPKTESAPPNETVEASGESEESQSKVDYSNNNRNLYQP